MTDAPKTIWAQDAVPDECDYTGGGWWDDTIGSTQYPHMAEYTLTSSVAAQLKAADELADLCDAASNDIEAIVEGGGYLDEERAIPAMRAALAAYRATKPTPE